MLNDLDLQRTVPESTGSREIIDATGSVGGCAHSAAMCTTLFCAVRRQYGEERAGFARECRNGAAIELRDGADGIARRSGANCALQFGCDHKGHVHVPESAWHTCSDQRVSKLIRLAAL